MLQAGTDMVVRLVSMTRSAPINICLTVIHFTSSDSVRQKTVKLTSIKNLQVFEVHSLLSAASAICFFEPNLRRGQRIFIG